MTRERLIQPATMDELNQLNIIYRQILFAWETTHKYTDVAAQLGIPLGTVRSRLNRARNALMKLRESKA